MRIIQANQYSIYIGNDSLTELNKFISGKTYSSVFVLTDEHTKKYCLPLLKKTVMQISNIRCIQIKSGEKEKNISTCEKIWNELSKRHADRKSLLINLGGGVITDIGGFCASTYKRGIDFIHLPTTLMAQTDASAGGKTGIDFNNYKNLIGTFAFPKAVFCVPDFLKTLTNRELISGLAEIIKHGLIADSDYWIQIKDASKVILSTGSSGVTEEIISRSIEIKNKIVSSDTYESGLRKVLNFGHTVGHAVESCSLKSRQAKKRLLHGEAIAIGMICEAYLSRKICGLKSEDLDAVTSFIISLYKPKRIKYTEKNLIDLMKQDKKNKDSAINFTLLSSIGKAVINNSCGEELIEESIKFFNSQCE